jgi:hypothetical protein
MIILRQDRRSPRQDSSPVTPQIRSGGANRSTTMFSKQLSFSPEYIWCMRRSSLCGLVVSVADYKHRGPGFDSRALLSIFLR